MKTVIINVLIMRTNKVILKIFCIKCSVNDIEKQNYCYQLIIIIVMNERLGIQISINYLKSFKQIF
jgi:hypothetical protein